MVVKEVILFLRINFLIVIIAAALSLSSAQTPTVDKIRHKWIDQNYLNIELADNGGSEKKHQKLSAPHLSIKTPLEKQEYELGQELEINCTANDGDPAAEIYWFLGDQPLKATHIYKDKGGSVTSVLKRMVTADDNGVILTCHAKHPGYPLGYTDINQTLRVHYKPIEKSVKIISDLKIGDPCEISIMFRSNPKPSSLIWIVDDKKVYYGAKTDRFLSRELSSVEENYWTASLRIANLTVNDVNSEKGFVLRVKNIYGQTDYQFKLTAENDSHGVDMINFAKNVIKHEDESTTIEMTSDSSEDTTTDKIQPSDEITTETFDDTIVNTLNSKISYGFITEPTQQSSDDSGEGAFLSVTQKNTEAQSTEQYSAEKTFFPTIQKTTDSPDIKHTTIEDFATDPMNNFQFDLTTEYFSGEPGLEITEFTDRDSPSTISYTIHDEPSKSKDNEALIKIELPTRRTVSKVVIFKRPISTTPMVTTETMVTISRTEKQSSILFMVILNNWKTSIIFTLFFTLIISILYHRRRIIRLKAKIIEKNLGNSYNSPHGSNAYTPTYLSRRGLDNSKVLNYQIESDGDSSVRSKSNYYTQTYNLSCHSYESIDDHVYAEIPSRRSSLTSNENLGGNLRCSIVNNLEYDHLNFAEPFETTNPRHYQASVVRGNESPHFEIFSGKMESTYI